MCRKMDEAMKVKKLTIIFSGKYDVGRDLNVSEPALKGVPEDWDFFCITLTSIDEAHCPHNKPKTNTSQDDEVAYKDS